MLPAFRYRLQFYKEDAFTAANKLTDEIRARLEKQIVAIEDAEIDELVKNIEVLYKSQLLKDLGYTPKIKEHDFIVTKAINEEVHYYYRHQVGWFFINMNNKGNCIKDQQQCYWNIAVTVKET